MSDPKRSETIPETLNRRLAAILHADVQGYSHMIEVDEVATLRVLTPSLEMMRAVVQQHGGQAVGSRGDSLLAEFPSARNAVQCAVALQQELRQRTAEFPAEQQVKFRMGIHVGEVVEDGGQLHGDGINIAVRLESLAEAGGILISGTVYDQVKTKLPLTYEDIGEQQLKNIAEPVRAYRVRWEEADSPQPTVQSTKGKVESPKPRRVGTSVFVSVLVFVVVLGGLVTLWSFFPSVFRLPHSELPTQEAQPPSLPLPDKPSIVVLPFNNMSGDPGQEYFSDGLTEVLTSDLSKISSLFVISRNSAFTYKGKATNVQDIGKELGVQYALEGSVLKADNQVRITAQLIDATTGGHIWTERFDRPFKDIFALQDEIVQKIVTTLKLQLTLREQGILVRKHTDNLEAYDAFLRGLEYFWRTTKEGNTQARQMFEKAIVLDPQYAEAYVWRGWTYFVDWIWRWSADPQTLERAVASAQQAIALDDSLPGAHSLLSNVYGRKQQYAQAIAEGEQAIALDPNDAGSYNRQGAVLNFAGRPEEALKMMERAMRLNPHYPPVYLGDLGWTYSLTGRYAEAVATLKEALSRSPNLMVYHVILADSYVQQWASQQSADAQALEQALAAAQRGLALNDSFSPGHQLLGYVYLWQKHYEQAIAEMERTIALDPNIANGYATLAETLSRVGRAEEAVRMAGQALHRKPFDVADQHLTSIGATYDLAGQPEEAIAPLKQYLARYPNILGAHLTLAAAYSELGQAAEARAEAAEVLRINPKFSLEVHKERVPIKDPALLARHIAALRKAGLK